MAIQQLKKTKTTVLNPDVIKGGNSSHPEKAGVKSSFDLVPNDPGGRGGVVTALVEEQQPVLR